MPEESNRSEEKNYQNVRIVNAVSGETIEDAEGVRSYFEREEQLSRDHGPSLYFQFFRVSLGAATMKALQGPQLAELKLPSDFVGGTERVAAVRARLRRRLGGRLRARLRRVIKGSSDPELSLGPRERITIFFAGRPMRDDRMFYGDHYVMLPAWFQVLIHTGSTRDVLSSIQALSMRETTPEA